MACFKGSHLLGSSDKMWTLSAWGVLTNSTHFGVILEGVWKGTNLVLIRAWVDHDILVTNGTKCQIVHLSICISRCVEWETKKLLHCTIQ